MEHFDTTYAPVPPEMDPFDGLYISVNVPFPYISGRLPWAGPVSRGTVASAWQGEAMTTLFSCCKPDRIKLFDIFHGSLRSVSVGVRVLLENFTAFRTVKSFLTVRHFVPPVFVSVLMPLFDCSTWVPTVTLCVQLCMSFTRLCSKWVLYHFARRAWTPFWMLCKFERHLGGFESTVHSKLLTIYFFLCSCETMQFARLRYFCTLMKQITLFHQVILLETCPDMTVTLPPCSNFVLNIIGTKTNPFIVISDLMLHSKPQPEKYPSCKILDILVLFPNDCVLISFVIPNNARKPICNLLYSQSYSIHIHGTTESLSIRYVVFHWFMIVKIVWKKITKWGVLEKNMQ